MATPNMGLTKWGATDNFSYAALAANWDAVDDHDHTVGNGVQIPTDGLLNQAVTSAKLATGAVTSGKIADGGVDQASRITDGIITGAKLAANTVPYNKLAKDATGLAYGAFRATSAAATGFTSGAAWKPATVEFDISGAYSTVSGRWTAPASGYYRLSWFISVSTTTADRYIQTQLKKNGTAYAYGSMGVCRASQSPRSVGTVLVLATAGDYFEVWPTTDAGTPTQDVAGSFAGELVGLKT